MKSRFTISTILLLLLLSSCLSTNFRQDEKQYQWQVVAITSIKHPYKGSSDWQITWTYEKVDLFEFQHDTAAMGYHIGFQRATLIER